MKFSWKILPALAGLVSGASSKPGEIRCFQIELSHRYRWYVAPVHVGLVVTSGILAAAILWSVTQTLLILRDRHDMQARLDHIHIQDHQLLAEAQREGIDLSGGSLQQLPAEVNLANQLLVKRNFSWTQLLSALEAAMSHHVSVKSIRLDHGSAVVHITGFAVTVDDVTALTLTLQNNAVFHDPVLGQHRLGLDGLVEFDLSLRYRQPGKVT